MSKSSAHKLIIKTNIADFRGRPSSQFYTEEQNRSGEGWGHHRQWSGIPSLFNIHGVGNDGKAELAPVVPKEKKKSIKLLHHILGLFRRTLVKNRPIFNDISHGFLRAAPS